MCRRDTTLCLLANGVATAGIIKTIQVSHTNDHTKLLNSSWPLKRKRKGTSKNALYQPLQCNETQSQEQSAQRCGASSEKLERASAMIRSVKNVRADNCYGAATSANKLLSPDTQRFFTATIEASLFPGFNQQGPTSTNGRNFNAQGNDKLIEL